MPKKPVPRLVKKPVAATGVKRAKTATAAKSSRPKTAAKKRTAAKATPTKSRLAKPKSSTPKSSIPKSSTPKSPKPKSPTSKIATSAPEKIAPRPRAKVIDEHPGNLRADDRATAELIGVRTARLAASSRTIRKRSAVDRVDDPPLPSEGSLVERVSDAIEHELSKIERIIGSRTRMAPVLRIETESRARVLASLARTLKEVMRLREQERGAGDDKAKAADDDAVPRDLDEFRRELSRRLEGMVAAAAPLPDGVDD